MKQEEIEVGAHRTLLKFRSTKLWILIYAQGSQMCPGISLEHLPLSLWSHVSPRAINPVGEDGTAICQPRISRGWQIYLFTSNHANHISLLPKNKVLIQGKVTHFGNLNIYGSPMATASTAPLHIIDRI